MTLNRRFARLLLMAVFVFALHLRSLGDPPKLVFVPASGSAQVTALNTQVTALSKQVALLTPSAFGAPVTNNTGHLFVLHHQMSDTGYGQEFFSVVGSEAGYTKLLTQARAAGADCLSCDLGAYDTADGSAQDVTNIYAAADALNAANGWGPGQTGATNALGVGKITLYITFDFSNTALENPAILVSILSITLKDPANLTIAGRPVWSCYVGGGGRSWASLAAIFQPMKAQLVAAGVTNPYGIWGGEPTNPDGSPSDNSLASLTAWCGGCVKPIADAVWSYSANPSSPLGSSSIIPFQERLSQAAHAAGIGFQGSVYPGYAFGRNWVHVGPDGLRAQWRSALDTQAPLFATAPVGAGYIGEQMTTGDDIPENSNLLPGYDPAVYHPAQGSDFYQDTAGKIASNSQYVHELKSGTRPVFTADTLNVWQPVQTGAAQAAPTGAATSDPYTQPLAGIVTETGYLSAAQAPALTDIECLLSASATVTLTSAQQPAAALTSLQTAANNTVIYDLAQPFTGQEVGQTLQVTYGSGWKAGNYTVTGANVFTPPGASGPTWYLVLDRAPGANFLAGGQGTLYPAGATLPALPPPPLVTSVFVSAGQTCLRLPNQAGNVQVVTLARNGQTLITLPGHGIVSTAQVANPNYWTGTAHN